MIVFFWIAVAIVTGLAGAARGRTGLGWFMIGLLFGPFALLAVLVMRDLRAEQEREKLARIAAEAAEAARGRAALVTKPEPWLRGPSPDA